MRPWDYECIASELLRALRAKRSQSAFARRLGYKSNVVHSWEVGRAFPTAARTLWAAQRVGRDVNAALLTLYRKPPGWFDELDPITPEGVAQFLCDLRGRKPVTQLASETGCSRFSVARWLKADTEPRLPDFLRLVESSTLRMLDFIAGLVEPEQLPSLKAAWRELELAREATYRFPWSQAVLRVLETEAYETLAVHRPGYVAQQLGITEDEARRALDVLLQTGQIERRGNKFTPRDDSQLVDTRRDPAAAQALREFWSEVALSHLKRPTAKPQADAALGLFSHSVFGVSDEDLKRIRELQKAYYQEVRAIVAQSTPVQRVALLNLQLVPLSGQG